MPNAGATSQLWRIAGVLGLAAAAIQAIGISTALWVWGSTPGTWLVFCIIEAALALAGGALALTTSRKAAPWLFTGAVLATIVHRIVVVGFGEFAIPGYLLRYFSDIVDYSGLLYATVTLLWDLGWFLAIVGAAVLGFIALAKSPKPATERAAPAYSTGSGIDAGWYADPNGLPAQRYWDGAAWTEQTRPQVGPTPSAFVPTASRPAGVPGNGMGTAGLVLGIVGMLLCGPLCILAIIFGAIGRARANRGLATNRGAATWGLVLGIVGTVLWIVGGVIIAAAASQPSPYYYG